MEEIKKCKKKARLPWKTKDFLTITSFLPWMTIQKTRNNPCLPWKTLKKETKNIRLPWKMTTKIKNITEIRQLDTVRDESYRAQQFTVRAAKHPRAADSIAPNHSTPRNADSVPFGASHGRSCRR